MTTLDGYTRFHKYFELSYGNIGNLQVKSLHSESISMVFATILQWSLPEDLALVFERQYSDADMPSLETCLEFLKRLK